MLMAMSCRQIGTSRFAAPKPQRRVFAKARAKCFADFQPEVLCRLQGFCDSAYEAKRRRKNLLSQTVGSDQTIAGIYVACCGTIAGWCLMIFMPYAEIKQDDAEQVPWLLEHFRWGAMKTANWLKDILYPSQTNWLDHVRSANSRDESCDFMGVSRSVPSLDLDAEDIRGVTRRFCGTERYVVFFFCVLGIEKSKMVWVWLCRM